MTGKLVTKVVDAISLRPFNVVVLRKGDSYGLYDCLTHNYSEPLIEFFDATYEGDNRFGFGNYGQFVSRYFRSQFFTCVYSEGLRPDPDVSERGLCLFGGTPEWSICGKTMREVIYFIVDDYKCNG